MIKIRITKPTDAPAYYAQGEYHADLTKQYLEVPPLFAAHLVGLGYAEYLAKDLREAESQAQETDLPDFVARETDDRVIVQTPSAGDVASVPTEELTMAAESAPETISEPPVISAPETEQGTPKPKKKSGKR